MKTVGIHEQILKNQETILDVLEFLITTQGFGDRKDLERKQRDLVERQNETYKLRNQ
jgi:hypothetical protein